MYKNTSNSEWQWLISSSNHKPRKISLLWEGVMGNYKMDKAFTLLNSTFKNGYYRIIGASSVTIFLLSSQGKTKNSVGINRN